MPYVKIDYKPPLGVMPKKIWDMQRAEELRNAIARYAAEMIEIPREWIEEYNDIVALYK